MSRAWSKKYPKPDWYYAEETTPEQRNAWSRKQSNKKYRERHPDRIKAAKKKCRDAKPETQRALTRKRRAIAKGCEGHHTARDIERIIQDQRYRCAYCKTSVRKAFHVDHIVPLSRGGSNWPSNLQIVCQSCNQRKYVRYAEEFARTEFGLLL